MTLKRSWPWLLPALLTIGACVVEGTGPGPFGAPGGGVGNAQLLIDLSFNGQQESCADAGVALLHIAIPNVPVEPRLLPCSAPPVQVEIDDLPAQSLSVTVEGETGGVVVLSATQQVDLTSGSAEVSMNMVPIPDAGEPDAGAVDAGIPDGGEATSEPVDSGSPADAGSDAGASTADAGDGG